MTLMEINTGMDDMFSAYEGVDLRHTRPEQYVVNAETGSGWAYNKYLGGWMHKHGVGYRLDSVLVTFVAKLDHAMLKDTRRHIDTVQIMVKGDAEPSVVATVIEYGAYETFSSKDVNIQLPDWMMYKARLEYRRLI